MFEPRWLRAQKEMEARGVDFLLAAVSSDLRYLTNYAGSVSERITCLVLPQSGSPTIVIPVLEEPRLGAAAARLRIAPWNETDDPFALIAEAVKGQTKPVIAVNEGFWAGWLIPLQEAIGGAKWRPATPLMRELRMRKDPNEIALLQAAAESVDRVFAQILQSPLVGRRESDISDEILRRIKAAGHEESEFAIVASGPNGASPHHHPGDRVLTAGDAVVLDFGGIFKGGYHSDITRTIQIGPPSPGFLEVYRVVCDAQEAAFQAVRPGVASADVDAAARDVIARAGYGDYFIHRTGHGIGMDGHEDPFIVAGNALPLEPGMTFSLEPGVYLPGNLGVRVEDIVVVTQAGGRRLNQAPRTPVVL